MSQGFPDPNSFQNAGGEPGKKKGSSAMKIVLIIGGIGGVVCLLCCGGLMFFGFTAVNMGMDMMATAIREDYGDHPAIQEHIGEIDTIESDYLNAGSYGNQITPGEVPFKVKGSNGEGSIIVRQGAPRSDGKPGVAGGRLILSNGDVIDLE